uniref:Uncharacterized protein n=1 Tax=Phakopsora pachyrhizi TaxID=170000 RepID=A0A0S1MIA2_PHAPC
MSALSQIPLANCINGPINPELWNSLGMDNYLKNYLGGKNLTLTVSLVVIMRETGCHLLHVYLILIQRFGKNEA